MKAANASRVKSAKTTGRSLYELTVKEPTRDGLVHWQCAGFWKSLKSFKVEILENQTYKYVFYSEKKVIDQFDGYP
jgi:hypothetical protein